MDVLFRKEPDKNTSGLKNKNESTVTKEIHQRWKMMSF